MLAKLSDVIFHRLGVKHNQREDDVTDIENWNYHGKVFPCKVIAGILEVFIIRDFDINARKKAIPNRNVVESRAEDNNFGSTKKPEVQEQFSLMFQVLVVCVFLHVVNHSNKDENHW